MQVPPNNIDVRDLDKYAELHSISGCVFLPVRPESVQLSLRTGSALLQMTGRPFRGPEGGVGCTMQRIQGQNEGTLCAL